jgi:hypothetical protein
VSKIEKEQNATTNEIEKSSRKNQEKDIKKRKIVGTHNCIICNKVKEYTSVGGYRRGANKPCKSCSNSIVGGGTGFVRPVDGKRKCGKCKKILSTENFVQYKGGQTHGYCKPCKSEHFRHYQKTVGRFKRYGITKEVYEEMRISQENKCYICGRLSNKLHIDHNHDNGAIRKLLCKECNMALGLVKEDLITLKNMINYLEEHQC